MSTIPSGPVVAISADAGLNRTENRPPDERIVVYVGTGSAGGGHHADTVHALDEGGPASLPPFTILRFCANSLAGALSIQFRFRAQR